MDQFCFVEIGLRRWKKIRLSLYVTLYELITKKNMIGPKTNPWGSPVIKLWNDETVLSIKTALLAGVFMYPWVIYYTPFLLLEWSSNRKCVMRSKQTHLQAWLFVSRSKVEVHLEMCTSLSYCITQPLHNKGNILKEYSHSHIEQGNKIIETIYKTQVQVTRQQIYFTN